MTFKVSKRLAWLSRFNLVLFGVIGAFLFYGLLDLRFSSGDAGLWIPKGTEKRAILDKFNERFGAEDLLFISWDDCSVDDSRLPELASRIRERDQQQAEEKNRDRLFHSIQTYQDFREKLESPYFDEVELRRQLAGFFVGRNNDRGVIILESTDAGAIYRDETFDLAKSESENFLGEETNIRFSGPCFLAISANSETKKTLLVISPIVAAISLLICILLVRNFGMAMIAFVTSGASALLGVAGLELGGKEFGNMLTVVPSLCQLIGMSNAIHLLNYYREHYVKTQDPVVSVKHALRVGWLPTVAATITTVLGISALATSNLDVAKDFALYCSIGISATAFCVLLLVPFFILAFSPRPKEQRNEIRFTKALDSLSRYLRWPITLFCFALLVVAGFGVGKIKSDVRMENFFPDHSKYQTDYDWYSEQFAAPQFSDLMISFPDDESVAKQLAIIDSIAEEVRKIDDSFAVFSPAIYALSLPPKAPESAYQQLWSTIKESSWVYQEKGENHWRISIRFHPAPNPEESDFREQVIGAVADATGKFDVEGVPKVILTGAYELFAGGQNSLLDQLLKTFLLAFLFITPVVILFLRSFKLGLIAILGNLFPLVIFFGLLGWLNYRIDIATMMIAAVAFGIAVDDTMHFLTWLKRGSQTSSKLADAIPFALQHCAVAIAQTTLIISIGMLAFLLCDFEPSARFAVFSSVVLVLAFIGDLIFLPALIRLFKGKRDLD